MAHDLDRIVKELSELTVVEASELASKLESSWGVSASVPMVSANTSSDEKKEDVKDEFNVLLKEIGSKKISVIKEVRSITGLGLKEAKDLVESAPKVIKESLGKDEANEIKSKLESVGATIELK